MPPVLPTKQTGLNSNCQVPEASRLLTHPIKRNLEAHLEDCSDFLPSARVDRRPVNLCIVLHTQRAEMICVIWSASSTPLDAPEGDSSLLAQCHMTTNEFAKALVSSRRKPHAEADCCVHRIVCFEVLELAVDATLWSGLTWKIIVCFETKRESQQMKPQS